MTKQARRPPAPAMSARFRIASGVSIMTQSATSAPPSLASTSATSMAEETFGTSTASGLAASAAARSSAPQGVDSALIRTITSRLPKPRAFTAAADLFAGERLGVGRHRILQIEDQRVGGKRARLFQCAGVRARHIEHAAARADGGHDRSPEGRWFLTQAFDAAKLGVRMAHEHSLHPVRGGVRPCRQCRGPLRPAAAGARSVGGAERASFQPCRISEGDRRGTGAGAGGRSGRRGWPRTGGWADATASCPAISDGRSKRRRWPTRWPA